MTSNLSITSSDRSAEFAAARSLVLRMLIFVAPIVVIGALVYIVGMRSGELTSVREVALAQTKSEPFIYLTKLSDHNFKLKLESAKLKRPDILVLGTSRSNQWRSGMFKPYGFYNAGNAQFRFADYSRFIEEMGPPYPKVIIFSLDFYQFDANWGKIYEKLAYDDIGYPETLTLSKSLLEQYITNPGMILRDPVDPVYGVRAVGLSASELGIGFRLDGSYQYGWAFGGARLGVDTGHAVARVKNGEPPFLFSGGLDGSETDAFKRFTDLAASKGIRLVAVTMPYDPDFLSTIESSNRHGIWRAFRTPAFQQWVRDQSVTYFDFAKIADFGGRSDEFVDTFHPSEPAYARMLLTMLLAPDFQAMVPQINPAGINNRLKEASAFEVFRNDF